MCQFALLIEVVKSSTGCADDYLNIQVFFMFFVIYTVGGKVNDKRNPYERMCYIQ